MTTEENKHVAADLFARFSDGDVARALDLMTDDVTWRIVGKPELTPAAGTYDKQRLTRLFEHMLSVLENGLKMTVLGSTAEDDRVAVEVASSGDLQNGRKYRQEYHLVMIFRDGKIAAVREYFDTHHAFDVWMRP